MFIVLLLILAGILFLVAIVVGIYTGIRQGFQQSKASKKKEGVIKHGDTVYVYPNGKVYHRTMFCSDSKSIPKPMSEKVAQIQGLHRCTKCWK